MTLRSLALAALLTLASFHRASAQLVWERPEHVFRAAAAQRVVTADYPFLNRGPYPVRIRALRTNCGCTAARPDRETIAPGERGVISVAFNIEGRKGFQDKKITVKTDDPASDTTLRLAGEVIDGLQIRPSVLRWDAAENGRPKTARLLLPPSLAQPPVLTPAEEAATLFHTNLSQDGPGGSWLIRATPRPEAAGRRARILVTLPGSGLPPAILHLAGPR